MNAPPFKLAPTQDASFDDENVARCYVAPDQQLERMR